METIYFSYRINLIECLYLTWNKICGKKFMIVSFVDSFYCKIFRAIRIRVDIADFSKEYMAYFDKEIGIYHTIEELFTNNDEFVKETKEIINMMGHKNEKMALSIKKYLVTKIDDDLKILTIAEQMYKEKAHFYFLKYSQLYNKKIKNKAIYISSLTPNLLEYLYLFYSCFRCINIMINVKNRTYKKSFRNNKIIYEEIYDYKGMRNPEFEAFYGYLSTRDRILFICRNENSDVFRFLKYSGKNVISIKNIFVEKRKRKEAIRVFLKYFFKVFFNIRLKSIVIKAILLKIFYGYLYYETLFKNNKDSFYIQTRSQFNDLHPVATVIGEEYGVSNIGYQCGSHSPNNPRVSYMHFNYFGLLGKFFKNDWYKNYWPSENETKYYILGPLTLETGKKHFKIEDKKIGSKFCIFTTSTSNDLWMSDQFYRNFIESICKVLSSRVGTDAILLFKEKSPSEWRIKYIEKTCLSYKLKFEIITNDTKNISNESLLNHSEIVFVMGLSNIAWEALAKKKKIIVFEQSGYSHPFEKYLPMIINRNSKELSDTINWLLKISKREYEKMIDHLLDSCSKVSDGNLIKDFIEAIENDNIKKKEGKINGF